jgi:predicted DNA-binding transcriptional regulator AlpA
MTTETKRFIRIGEVKHLTSLSKTTIRRLELQGKFPKRYKLAQKVAAWDYGEVIKWMSLCTPITIANKNDLLKMRAMKVEKIEISEIMEYEPYKEKQMSLHEQKVVLMKNG